MTAHESEVLRQGLHRDGEQGCRWSSTVNMTGAGGQPCRPGRQASGGPLGSVPRTNWAIESWGPSSSRAHGQMLIVRSLPPEPRV